MRNKSGKRALLVLLAVAVFAAPAAVVASHQFTDVPDTNVFHDDIGWLADAGVTKGCNPPTNDEFCPSDNVTREQMAAFMRRFAQYLGAEDGIVDAADDAATVGGYTADQLKSVAYEARNEGVVTLPASATTDVQTLALPAGSYLIHARASVNSNAGAALSNTAVTCTLTAGTSSQTINNLFLNANLQPGETEEVPFMLTHTFDAAGSAVLSCTTNATWAGNVIDPTVTAISVQEALSTVNGAGLDNADAVNN